MQRVCRLCFLKFNNPLNIFTTPNLLDKILRLTDIRIQPNDGLPWNVCHICYAKVEIADKFREDVNRTDRRIRAFLQKKTASNTTGKDLLNRVTKDRVYKWCHESSINLFRTGSRSTENVRPNKNQDPNWSVVRSNDARGAVKWSMRNSETCGDKHSPRTLIYSNATGRALAGSYRILIDHCLAIKACENFVLPSFYADNEDGPKSDFKLGLDSETLDDQKKFSEFDPTMESKSLRGIIRGDTNHDYKSKQISHVDTNHQNGKLTMIQTDPLNLLKVKVVTPLSERNLEDFPPARSYGQLFDTGRPSTPSQVEKHAKKKSGEPRKSEASSYVTASELSELSIYQGSKLLKTSGTREFNTSLSFSTSKKNDLSYEEKVNCPVCNRVCANVRGLKVHLKSHRSPKCPICTAPTLSGDAYRVHMNKHIKVYTI